MSNLLSGLEAFGLGNLIEKLDVYEKKEEKQNKGVREGEQPIETIEFDVLFYKTMTCPVCDLPVQAKTIKTGRVKLLGLDTDLRPKYQSVDSLKYDAIVCQGCGYAALRRYFGNITTTQIASVKEKITPNFKGKQEEEEIYSYDEAIMRHKLSLVTAIVKSAKVSERAYICLKLAWLYRGKRENLPVGTSEYETVSKQLHTEESEFLQKAFLGFKEAFSTESFPLCGMDEMTCMYLIGELARRSGEYQEASQWISRVLISKSANDRIKDKARTIKELLREER